MCERERTLDSERDDLGAALPVSNPTLGAGFRMKAARIATSVSKSSRSRRDHAHTQGYKETDKTITDYVCMLIYI